MKPLVERFEREQHPVLSGSLEQALEMLPCNNLVSAVVEKRIAQVGGPDIKKKLKMLAVFLKAISVLSQMFIDTREVFSCLSKKRQSPKSWGMARSIIASKSALPVDFLPMDRIMKAV